MTVEINLTPTCSYFDLVLGRQAIECRTWGMLAECKALALLIHGLGAHSGWFEAFGRQLKVRGVFAVAYDQVGFGKRRNQKFFSYHQWLDELLQVFDYLKERAKDRPLYLMGNSMGALLAIVALKYIYPDGLVLFSPGFDGCPETFTISYRLKTILRSLLNPQVEVDLPYGVEHIARDKTIRNWIAADPQKRFGIPGKMVLELLRLTKEAKKIPKTVTPIFMFTAGFEQVVNNKVNEEFYVKLKVPFKQHAHFPEAWHDLMFDEGIDEIACQILEWQAQCARKCI